MMGKVVFWIVVVFVVLLGLRLLNAAKAKRRADAAQRRTAATASEPMVRCQRCGVFLPRAEAKAAGDGYVCGDPKCRPPQ